MDETRSTPDSPYAPPTAEVETFGGADLGPRARAFIVLLGFGVVLRSAAFGWRIVGASDTQHLLAMVAAVWAAAAAFVGCAIAFWLWLYRAYQRARQLAPDLRYTPGSAVAVWFVPLVNLVGPYIAMRELWCATFGGAQWRETPASKQLPWWWIAWVTILCLHPGLFGLLGLPYEAVQVLVAVDEVATVAAAVLAMRIVFQITRAQRERRDDVASGANDRIG